MDAIWDHDSFGAFHREKIESYELFGIHANRPLTGKLTREISMNSSRWIVFISSIKLFNLLFEQFSGSDGELPLAITYLEEAAGEQDGVYKATLIRIAKAKIRNADILGSILLQLAHDQLGPLSIAKTSDELESF